MRIVLAILNFIALIGAIIWYISAPDWEPVITSVVLFGSLLTQLFISEEVKSKIKLVQKSNKDSHNYQASGDQNITDEKLIQSGGKGAQQLQAKEMTVQIMGVDEKRAREIYQEMNLQLRKDYSQEALDIANSRVIEFENKLMHKMTEIDGALEAFADPSFQMLLVDAQKTAAATERPHDYDLLSELLVHRFQQGENRNKRAGIGLAVEIVDKISDEALLGLTVTHAVNTFTPLSGNINEGLDVLNNLFEKILYGELPTGHDWLDHLDILNAVRLNSLGSMKKIQQYYPEQLSGYVDVGIEKNSENYDKAIEILKDNKLPNNLLIEHDFNNDYLRLSIPNKNNLDQLSLLQQIQHQGAIVQVPVKLSEQQVNAIESIYNLYSQDSNLKRNNVNLFMEEWDKRQSLQTIRVWWDNISMALTITSVGKVLAHSNAQRCDKKLPPLN